MLQRAKRRERKRRATSRETRTLAAREIDVGGEIEHIVRCAEAGQTRIVTLGPLVLCCVPGSAWVLDAGDSLAYCLMGDNVRRPSPLRFEAVDRYALAWEATFEVKDSCFFTLVERKAIGRPAVPAVEITRAVASARKA